MSFSEINHKSVICKRHREQVCRTGSRAPVAISHNEPLWNGSGVSSDRRKSQAIPGGTSVSTENTIRVGRVAESLTNAGAAQTLDSEMEVMKTTETIAF